MNRQWFGRIGSLMAGSLLLAATIAAPLHAEEAKGSAPPVSQQLVSEGEYAVKLGNALGVTTSGDVVEAENQLANLGIMPRNGWIADYPVTPDIVLELQESVYAAAEAKKISLTREEAAQRLTEMSVGVGLTIGPDRLDAYGPTQASCVNYPNPATVMDTYVTSGPPVVTYYCPPPTYYYLYDWVPSPFMWGDFWYPGFYVLRDFDRIEHREHRAVVISNHFRDERENRAYRIDPVDRFHGRSYYGIGGKPGKGALTTGDRKGDRNIFETPRGERFRGHEGYRGSERGGEWRGRGGEGGDRGRGGYRGGEGGGSRGGERGGGGERRD